MASTTELDDLGSLPSVDDIVGELSHLDHLPRSLVVSETRYVLNERRHALVNHLPYDAAPITAIVEKRLRRLMTPSLRRVINATGIILHPNLGRAPLDDFHPVAGYSNLEYDLKGGMRAKRDVHTSAILERLIGRTAVLVNNNAAAVYLVLRELAAGHEVIISRGEMIEIGDGLRIPEIMCHSGAILREVGTTNRTHVDDYRKAINERTRVILRVHPSNFRQVGFTARPAAPELAELGRQCGVPVYEDLGSGSLVDLRADGVKEPLVSESFAAGMNLVSFSCDKLLGGPQCGIIAGDCELVQRVRRNPMYRALRCDKLVIDGLASTLLRLLAHDWAAIPTLRMIRQPVEQIHFRADRLAARLAPLNVSVRPGESALGSGATPDQHLATWLIELQTSDAEAVERRLRRAPIPVIARIEHNYVVVDLRTVDPCEEQDLVAAIQSAALSS